MQLIRLKRDHFDVQYDFNKYQIIISLMIQRFQEWQLQNQFINLIITSFENYLFMDQTKQLIQLIRNALYQRIDDILQFYQLVTHIPNKLQCLYNLGKKQNQRNIELFKYSGVVYDSLKKQTPESMADIIKILYQSVVTIFKKMNIKFQYNRNISKTDYASLIEIFKYYFIFSNDIRMINKVEELQKNKALKKPLVLNILIKNLLIITREFFNNKIHLINQTITQKQVQDFQKQKLLSNKNSIEKMDNNKISKKDLCYQSGLRSNAKSQQLKSDLKSLKITNHRFFHIKKPSIGDQVFQSEFTTVTNISKQFQSNHRSSLLPSDIILSIKNKLISENRERRKQYSNLSTQQMQKRNNIVVRKKKKIMTAKLQQQDKNQLFNKIYGVMDVEHKSVHQLIKSKSKNDYSIKYAINQTKIRNRDILRGINNECERRNNSKSP